VNETCKSYDSLQTSVLVIAPIPYTPRDIYFFGACIQLHFFFSPDQEKVQWMLDGEKKRIRLLCLMRLVPRGGIEPPIELYLTTSTFVAPKVRGLDCIFTIAKALGAVSISLYTRPIDFSICWLGIATDYSRGFTEFTPIQ
jgi:hypothetical protein